MNSTQPNYCTYSEFLHKDPLLSNIDERLSGGFLVTKHDEGGHKHKTEKLSGQEFQESMSEDWEAYWEGFDWRHPIRIYEKHEPRLIQVGFGSVTDDRMPYPKESFLRDLEGIPASKSAFFLQAYYAEKGEAPSVPVFCMYTGMRIQKGALGDMPGIPPSRFTLPSWISSLSSTRKTPLQVLREGVLCARQITVEGLASLLFESMAESFMRIGSHLQTKEKRLLSLRERSLTDKNQRIQEARQARKLIVDRSSSLSDSAAATLLSRIYGMPYVKNVRETPSQGVRRGVPAVKIEEKQPHFNVLVCP